MFTSYLRPKLTTFDGPNIKSMQSRLSRDAVTLISVFEAAAADLDELPDTVTSDISFCDDMCVPTYTYFTLWLSQLQINKHIPMFASFFSI